MGCVSNIGYELFPEQGALKGTRVAVLFHYDTERKIFGTVVRDDVEAPWRTIIRLDDGRFILATECQYSPIG